MILFPNAKINIGLRVLRRRPDGYHDLDTVMVPINWCDILEIVPSPDGATRLFTTGRPVACPPEKNLVMKAIRALEQVCPVPPAHIHLHKVIPDGAGLGGGSADAAFTLLGLNELFSLGLSREVLAEVAAGIGADCPFFIYNRPTLCTGTGTTLTPIDMPRAGLWLLIAKPKGESVGTAEAYAGIHPAESAVDYPSAIAADPRRWVELGLTNDFEPSVFTGHPAIAALKEAIARAGALYSAMSGSGAAVYGIFSTEADATAAAETLTDADMTVCPLNP